MAARADPPGDSLDTWFRHYQQLAVTGVRSVAVAQKITLHLDRFRVFFLESYGHERITACLRRDVQAWQHALIAQGLVAATINNRLASLSACTTWIHAQAPHLFPAGDPAKGIGDLGLPLCTLPSRCARRSGARASRTGMSVAFRRSSTPIMAVTLPHGIWSRWPRISRSS